MANTGMVNAKKAKNDEYYTQYSTIERELIYYKDYLRGKIVYCNCDTPDSNFVKFLNDVKQSWDIAEVWHTSLNEGYPFDSDYAIDLLKKCDVVISNPPFSLFNQYISLLFEYNKDFLIIGNVVAVNYEEMFYRIKDNAVRYGVTIHSGHTKFIIPDGSLKEVSVRWYTNIDCGIELPFLQSSGVAEYDFFDDTDIINVDKTAEIPCDYDGIMGVPTTFLDKYNPKQFEILGLAMHNRYFGDVPCYTVVGGYKLFARLLIRRLS